MKNVLLFLILLMSAAIGKAEAWTYVGQAKWTEGALKARNTDVPKTWDVRVERSDERPKVFRLQPYSTESWTDTGRQSDDVYVYLHTENIDAIYMEYYNYHHFSNYFHVFQRCPENGFDTRYYGKISEENTIFFHGGAFVVIETSSSSKPSPSSSNTSGYIHKIVFPEGVLDYVPEEESWVKIGTGEWIDPVYTGYNDEPARTETDIERSVQNPDKYRVRPWKENIEEGYWGDLTICDETFDVIINTENPSKVYITTYYPRPNDPITQDCKENGLNGSLYGRFNKGKIIIPSNYFKFSGISSCLPGRYCIITLPYGFNKPLTEDNGIFMGITAFNEELTTKPISLLNENTKEEFTTFVDGLEMSNATLLYYAVDQAINTMQTQTYPDNLSNAILITLTDGLDQGSLALKREHRTSRGYASYLADRIANTSIQGIPLETYAIGLMSDDVYDEELFMYNLQSLASDDKNISPVNNIEELQQKLTELFDNLDRWTSQRVVSIKVPEMSHGDKYRFTLDHSRNDVSASEVWFEGVYNIDNMSLDDITYHGFTSSSGTSIKASQEGIKLLFTLKDCRDLTGNILEVDKDGIDQWQYIPNREIWNHNVENAKEGDVDIQNIKSSVAIMFALDCSTSLGDLFPLVKTTANSFIRRLAGEDPESGIDDVIVNNEETIDINDPDVEIYNLQGVRVAHPTHGIYICRKGNTVKKIAIR